MKKNLFDPARNMIVSVQKLHAMLNPETPCDNAGRVLQFESLEARRVLSANSFADSFGGEPDSGYVAQETVADETVDTTISHIVVSVNGENMELNRDNNTLKLNAGDVVQIQEVHFTHSASDGVFAVESYLNKIANNTSASLTDYHDGRFSGAARDALANGEGGVVQGTSDGWTVESGWDRLSVNLMHYGEDSTSVSGRFFVQIQVGQPDFEFDTEVLDSVTQQTISAGSEVTLPAKWYNSAAGQFHNYAEVDIYSADNTEQIIWAGAAVGNPNNDYVVDGEFLNTRESDSFTHRWIPNQPGEYVLKFYLDPEQVVAETNELNNQYEIRLTVAESPLVAEDDFYEVTEGGTVVLNPLENDRSDVAVDREEATNLRFTFTNEQRYAWGFGVLNKTADSSEWEVVIRNADYQIDADALSGRDLFTYRETQNADGTFNHTFTGTEELGGYQALNIEWFGVNFGRNVDSDGFEIYNGDDAGTTKNFVINQVSQPENGTVTLNEDGTLTYVAAPGHTGHDCFGYTFTDGDGVSNTGEVNIEVVEEVESRTSVVESPAVSAIPGGELVTEATQTVEGTVINVTETPAADFSIGDFGIINKAKGEMPVDFETDGDLKNFKLRISNVPDYLTFSHAEETDGYLEVDGKKIDGLQVTSAKDFYEYSSFSNLAQIKQGYAVAPVEIVFELLFDDGDDWMVVNASSFNVYAYQELA